jgi:hypothetical protein
MVPIVFASLDDMIVKAGEGLRWYQVSADAERFVWDVEPVEEVGVVTVHGVELGEATEDLGFEHEVGKDGVGFDSGQVVGGLAEGAIALCSGELFSPLFEGPLGAFFHKVQQGLVEDPWV